MYLKYLKLNVFKVWFYQINSYLGLLIRSLRTLIVNLSVYIVGMMYYQSLRPAEHTTFIAEIATIRTIYIRNIAH